MKGLTIFFGNNEQPLYVQTEQVADFLDWFRTASGYEVYTIKGRASYHIQKSRINYVKED